MAVGAGFGKCETLLEGALVDVDFYDGGDETNVLVVGYSAAVVDFRAQEV